MSGRVGQGTPVMAVCASAAGRRPPALPGVGADQPGMEPAGTATAQSGSACPADGRGERSLLDAPPAS